MKLLKLRDLLPEIFFDANIFKYADELGKIVDAFDALFYDETWADYRVYDKIITFYDIWDFTRSPFKLDLFTNIFGALPKRDNFRDEEWNYLVDEVVDKFLVFLPFSRKFKGTRIGFENLRLLFGVPFELRFRKGYLLRIGDSVSNSYFAIGGGAVIGSPIYEDNLPYNSPWLDKLYDTYIADVISVGILRIFDENDELLKEENYGGSDPLRNYSYIWVRWLFDIVKTIFLPFSIVIRNLIIGDVVHVYNNSLAFEDGYGLNIQYLDNNLLDIQDVPVLLNVLSSMFQIEEYISFYALSFLSRVRLASELYMDNAIIDWLHLFDVIGLFMANFNSAVILQVGDTITLILSTFVIDDTANLFDELTNFGVLYKSNLNLTSTYEII